MHARSVVYATPVALGLGVDLRIYLDRHVRSDWGDELCFEGQQLNDAALGTATSF